MNFVEKAEIVPDYTQKEKLYHDKENLKQRQGLPTLRCFDKWKEYVDKGKTQDKDKKCAH